MKKLSYRSRNILSSKKGETIVEVMVAFVILLICLAGVSAMITTSLRITSLSVMNAKSTQEELINPLVLGEYGEKAGEITFSNVEYQISTTHRIRFSDEQNMIAFTPEGW